MKITPENILCIVPARSGSKGIKNKNIKKLAGIPLINYTLETASKTFPKENIIISSDSKEIIKMGEPFEIKTPFLRPKKLASDYSKTIFTVLDIINRLENNYEAVCLLQPTSPFRSKDDIMNCISIINKNRCDSVVSVNKIEEPHPKKMKKIKNGILVKIDTGAFLNGFHGDSCISICVGEVSSKAQNLSDVAHKALYAGLSKIKAGNTLLDVAGEIEDIVKKNGFSVVEDYTGHGVGRNLHEEPSVFNFRTKELPNVVLREGMTLAVEPIVNEGTKFCKTLNDRWTVITKDGKLSAQWEHTIVVLKDGIEILTDRDF